MQSLTHRKNLISDGSNEPEDHAGAVVRGSAGMFWVECFPRLETHPYCWQAAPCCPRIYRWRPLWPPSSTSSGLWDVAVILLPSVLEGPRVPSPAARCLNALRNRKQCGGKQRKPVTCGERLTCKSNTTDGEGQRGTQLPMTILPGDISTGTPEPERSVSLNGKRNTSVYDNHDF